MVTVAGTLVALSSSASGLGPVDETKLVASDGAASDFFGYSVGMSGDRIVVGAPEDDDNGDDSGSVYVFESDGSGGWVETKLVASDGAASDFFGVSVGVSGDRIVVGAPNDDDSGLNSGSVYVFESDGSGGWVETKLVASDSSAVDVFGLSVGVSGDRIVVGAYRDDDNGTDSGSVYVFESDGSGGWVETKVVASDGAAGDFFGDTVGVSGDRIVVGARNDDDNGTDSGSVYVFESDGSGGWVETKLVASDGAAGDGFGISVGVSGDRIVVGARSDDTDNGANSGSVYVFESDGSGGWVETKLVASDGAAGDGFGISVGVSGDRIVVGAPQDDDSGLNSGSVYVFESDGSGGWIETKLVASDGSDFDLIGLSGGVSGDRIVVGARFDDTDNGANSGSVYVFESVTDRDGDGVLDDIDNCVDVANADQLDADEDGLGDVCDSDDDNDGIDDDVDNCVDVANSDQLDADGDGLGDVCDSDDDNDGVDDETDACPDTRLGDADRPDRLRANRYYANADGVFVDADGNEAGYTVADTGGCSASQIIEAAGLGKGHQKFGITGSSLDDWVASQG